MMFGGWLEKLETYLISFPVFMYGLKVSSFKFNTTSKKSISWLIGTESSNLRAILKDANNLLTNTITTESCFFQRK